MDLKQLQYFLTIVEEGSITAAAARLHVTQPPLSQQLKKLEMCIRDRYWGFVASPMPQPKNMEIYIRGE